MAGKRNVKLSSGRPPNVTKPQASMSSQATRKLIRTHHTLNKKLETAKSKGDDAEAAQVQAEIEKLGGLKAYQQASIQGQSIDRGGDSSMVLMKWLEPTSDALSKTEPKTWNSGSVENKLTSPASGVVSGLACGGGNDVLS